MALNAWQKIEWEAEKVREKNPKLTKAQSVALAMERNPDLLREYDANRDAIESEERNRREFNQIYARLQTEHAARPPADSALAELNEAATARKATTGESFAQAFTAVLRANPVLYSRHVAEQQAGR